MTESNEVRASSEGLEAFVGKLRGFREELDPARAGDARDDPRGRPGRRDGGYRWRYAR